jgi:O-methyltransferase
MVVATKTKCLIFGAGGGGKILTKEIEEKQYPFEIIAYADNDPKLQGTLLFGKPVIHPNKESPPQSSGDSLFSILGNNSARVTGLKNTAQLIYDNHIPGATAELGVFQGDFAKEINILFPDRLLYLFDTFEEFPEKDVEKEKEIGTKRIFERSYNYSGTSIELVMGKMKNPEKCIIRKGFFPETAKELEETFAFVSLDADLYQPMLEGLQYFYPRLSEGGYIFIHDFFTNDFTGTKEAVLEYRRRKKICLVPIGDDCSIGIVKV